MRVVACMRVVAESLWCTGEAMISRDSTYLCAHWVFYKCLRCTVRLHWREVNCLRKILIMVKDFLIVLWGENPSTEMFTCGDLQNLGQVIWPPWAWILLIYKMCMITYASQKCWENSGKQWMWKYIISFKNYIFIYFCLCVFIYATQHLLNICFTPHLVLRIRTIEKIQSWAGAQALKSYINVRDQLPIVYI